MRRGRPCPVPVNDGKTTCRTQGSPREALAPTRRAIAVSSRKKNDIAVELAELGFTMPRIPDTARSGIRSQRILAIEKYPG